MTSVQTTAQFKRQLEDFGRLKREFLRRVRRRRFEGTIAAKRAAELERYAKNLELQDPWKP